MRGMVISYFIFAVFWWGALLVLINWRGRLAQAPNPPDAHRINQLLRLNLACLAVGILSGLLALAVPITDLMGAFDQVALIAPDEKTGALEAEIDRIRSTTMSVGLVGILQLPLTGVVFYLVRAAVNRMRDERRVPGV